MRIGIDATCLANARGYGRSIRDVVTAIAAEAPQHEVVCLVDEGSASVIDVGAPGVTQVIVRQSAPSAESAREGRRRIADLFRLAAAARRAKLDVFLSSSLNGCFLLPPGLPVVVAAHEIADEASPSLWHGLMARATRRLAVMQARLVMAPSEVVARQLASRLGVVRARIRVTAKGVSDVFARTQCAEEIRAAAERARLPQGAQWLMYVGGFGAGKHVDLIVRAHAAIAARRGGTPLMLILAGPHDDGAADVTAIRAVIKSCGTEHLVRWVGILPDREMRHLYSGALALILVSESEGFGGSAVEAARCGTPVIATKQSPLPDLLEGGGIFVAPGDLKALESAIDRLAADEPFRAELGTRAREKASMLSWSQSARAILSALEEVGLPAEEWELNAHARN